MLTSKGTFSGAEEFAFDLKNQKRATIVGETTGGGAHPVSGHPVGDYFMVGVPFAKSLDPVTKTNWEGTGVEPDVKVTSEDALGTAEKLAQEKIHSAKKMAKTQRPSHPLHLRFEITASRSSFRLCMALRFQRRTIIRRRRTLVHHYRRALSVRGRERMWVIRTVCASSRSSHRPLANCYLVTDE